MSQGPTHSKSRPERFSIQGELGKIITLPSEPTSFEHLGRGHNILLLGLGPDPAALASQFQLEDRVAFVECPAFEQGLGSTWAAKIPAHWHRVAERDLAKTMASATKIILYSPNLALFPSFWGPLWAKCRIKIHGLSPIETQEIWIAGTDRDLLVPEISLTLTERRFKAIRFHPGQIKASLENALKTRQPRAFVCINFQGLDPLGETFYLLRETGVPVLVWCVDNPFHLLTNLKSPFWKDCRLFLSDSWFVPELERLGAKDVRFLPLATSATLFHPRQDPAWSWLNDRAVFVGRSQFPGKQSFFAGCSIASTSDQQTQTMLSSGQRPDYAWWLAHLELPITWPDRSLRQAGFGAETATQHWRTACINAMAKALPCTVFGDANWQTMLSADIDLRPEVDYYGPLSHIYEQARVTLNVTSLLLPQGLTQRHFDVWAAGGLLISDATPGLSLFPAELTRETTFQSPEQARQLASDLCHNPARAQDLKQAWRELILAKHTMAHRVDEMLDLV